MKPLVVLALGPGGWDADFVRAVARPESGVDIVRRCTDFDELFSAALTAPGATAVIGADLPRLSSSGLQRLAEACVPVLGLADDDAARRSLHGMGVDEVLRLDADPTATVGELVTLVSGGRPRPALVAVGSPTTERSNLVAVWGPPGAPGRTSVAVAIADECSRAGTDTLLIDADPVAPAVAAVLGLCDDVPTIDQLGRRAPNSDPTGADVAALACRLGSRLRLIAGAVDATPPTSLWTLAAARAELVVVDAGPGPVLPDGLLPAASLLVGVAAGEPINLARFVTRWPALVAATPGIARRIVVTRVRRDAVGGSERTIADVLDEHGVGTPWFVPDDRNAYDAALLSGRTLAEAASGSPARQSLREFAATLPGELGIAGPDRVLQLR